MYGEQRLKKGSINKKKQISCLGGYSIGYHIVRTALENNKNLKADYWTNLKAVNVLRKGVQINATYYNKIKTSFNNETNQILRL